MKRFQWIAIGAFERAGWPGVAGLVLLAACALYYLLAVHPLQKQVAELGIAIASDQGKSTGRSAGSAQGDLVEFRKSFESAATLEEQLTALHDAAKATGLVFKRIEYRMADDRRATLRQYQIVMPATGKYPQIRQFLSLSLAKVPALSLDHITFQRKRIGDAAVDAELRFTLFLVDPV